MQQLSLVGPQLVIPAPLAAQLGGTTVPLSDPESVPLLESEPLSGPESPPLLLLTMQLWFESIELVTQVHPRAPQLESESLDPDVKQLHGHWLAVNPLGHPAFVALLW